MVFDFAKNNILEFDVYSYFLKKLFMLLYSTLKQIGMPLY
jgi:hypothetical protein